MSEINYNINLDYDPENEELAVILNNADNFCNALELADIYSHCAAVFEGSEDISVDFDISEPSWTVVKIYDNKTGNFIETMNADDFYAENEDFDNDYSFDDENEDY